MPRRDFFPKGRLRASRGYPLRSQRDFVRNWLFAAIFRSNFRRWRAARGGRSLSKRSYSALAIYTKGWAR